MAILAHLAKLTTQPINQPTDCYRQNYLNCSFFKSGSYLELPYQILAKSDKNGNFSPFTFSHIDQPTDQPLAIGKLTMTETSTKFQPNRLRIDEFSLEVVG